MECEFPRILTLLRKEKGISQKEAAITLGISQALLSHYEKGIRECGLDFVVKCANFYSVSCDYLLGRSPERSGASIAVDTIPDADAGGRQNVFGGSILPTLNKKLVSNSLNILFDLLARTGSDTLIAEVSDFLMLAVYRMFRVVYAINPKNQKNMFTLPELLSKNYADAAMQISEANAGGAIAENKDNAIVPEKLAISTESISGDYPLFASSLLNLIRNCEKNVNTKLSRTK